MNKLEYNPWKGRIVEKNNYAINKKIRYDIMYCIASKMGQQCKREIPHEALKVFFTLHGTIKNQITGAIKNSH